MNYVTSTSINRSERKKQDQNLKHNIRKYCYKGSRNLENAWIHSIGNGIGFLEQSNEKSRVERIECVYKKIRTSSCVIRVVADYVSEICIKMLIYLASEQFSLQYSL